MQLIILPLTVRKKEAQQDLIEDAVKDMKKQVRKMEKKLKKENSKRKDEKKKRRKAEDKKREAEEKNRRDKLKIYILSMRLKGSTIPEIADYLGMSTAEVEAVIAEDVDIC